MLQKGSRLNRLPKSVAWSWAMRSSGGARRVTIRSTSGGRSPPSDVCSSTSTGYLFLNAVLPEMGVISCGTGNKYGHPHEETLSILRDAKVDVYRTDLQGTITIGSDGQNFTVGTERFVPDSQLNPTDPSSSSTAQQAYIGNVNSKKFHLPTCPNLPAEKNQVLFSSYDEAIAAGYTPCASCIK